MYSAILVSIIIALSSISSSAFAKAVPVRGLYLDGNGVQQGGDREAMVRLAKLYLEGKGGARDLLRARQLIQQARTAQHK